ncbi:hypothetical protein R5H32_20020 [Defluviimonas sp. D31]|uniref:hypothetical protein n=1 Tax=Defluviimonas sp. D31 TaxID=3083253 RepID=UPI00296F1267|nr:hypothetical protein [Defluviimonas sp. D31]MDW4551629.1 hypothetical protein [Defluviimonas sp. D31]
MIGFDATVLAGQLFQVMSRKGDIGFTCFGSAFSAETAETRGAPEAHGVALNSLPRIRHSD